MAERDGPARRPRGSPSGQRSFPYDSPSGQHRFLETWGPRRPAEPPGAEWQGRGTPGATWPSGPSRSREAMPAPLDGSERGLSLAREPREPRGPRELRVSSLGATSSARGGGRLHLRPTPNGRACASPPTEVPAPHPRRRRLHPTPNGRACAPPPTEAPAPHSQRRRLRPTPDARGPGNC